jgi:hypothetical protein
MRADTNLQPPSLKTKHNSRKLTAGRPRYYGYNDDMLIWVAVQEMKTRTRLSINQICRKFKFNTFIGCFDPSRHHHCITRETLRHRYNSAADRLRDEQRERDEFARLLQRVGAHSPLLDLPLPIASIWNAELRRRLAEPA